MGNNNSNFIIIYSTPKPSEIALIKSLLGGANIRYFISNENLNALYGPADGFTTMDVLVEKEKVEEASELLKDLIYPDRTPEE